MRSGLRIRLADGLAASVLRDRCTEPETIGDGDHVGHLIHLVLESDVSDKVCARAQDLQSHQKVKVFSGRNDITLERVKGLFRSGRWILRRVTDQALQLVGIRSQDSEQSKVGVLLDDRRSGESRRLVPTIPEQQLAVCVRLSDVRDARVGRGGGSDLERSRGESGRRSGASS